jgi:Tetratricopeptide repeat
VAIEPPPVVKAAPPKVAAPQSQEKQPAPPAPKPAPKPVAKPAPPKPVAKPAPKPEVEEPAPAVLEEFVSDLESSLGEDFLTDTAAKPASLPQVAKQPRAPETELAPVAHSEPVVSGQHAPALGEFVADLEASLGDDFLTAAPVAASEVAAATPAARPASAAHASASAATSAAAVAPAMIHSAVAPSPAPIAPPQPVASAALPAEPAKGSAGRPPGIDLAEMFGELKQELEADAASSDEDPETHYNLGIAFREMGLLDEAIGELQKACQAVERGHPFPQVMQTYTWLAQCFLDKGVPEAAVRWYEKALSVNGIDQETRTALNYELGSASEAAGDKTRALQHFMQVYGSNIDYRDVAERIKALKS